MVVTLEIVRFIQAAFMEWDETFFHEDKEATATTSNLNDQLALVDYIFSIFIVTSNCHTKFIGFGSVC